MTRFPSPVRHRALFAFVLLNSLFAAAHAQRYLAVAGTVPSWPGLVFATLALLAQVGLCVVVLLPVLWLVGLVDPWALASRLVGALLFTLLNAFIYVDSRIFGLFRFHFNSLALNVLLTPGGFESMQLPARDLAVAGAGIGLLFVLELAVYTFLLRGLQRTTVRPVRPARRWLAFVGVVLGLLLAERLTYVTGDVLGSRDITRQASVIPFYEPLLVRRSLARAVSLPADLRTDAGDPRGGLLNYPRAPVVGRVKPDRRWNIVWIVVESWRSDLLSPENTPNVWRFSRKAQVFRRHLSGGNSTRFGIFSMLYGLHGTYWWPVLTESRGPVLLSKLVEERYRFSILSSTSLGYPEFRRTAFVSVVSSIRDKLPGRNPMERDVPLERAFEAFVASTPHDEPFFAFLFVGSPHFPFLFPAEYTKYLPIQDLPSVSEAESRDGAHRMFNRYRNSVLYADSVLGRILNGLEQGGLLERSVVVLTGDHGQEFYEHGFFGHGSAFTPEQTQVPLVMYVPRMAFREYSHLTQHQDLPATMLALLGVDDPPDRYSLGRNMLEAVERPYAVVCGFRDCALEDADGWVVFGIEGKTTLWFDVRDRDYAEVEDRTAAVSRRAQRLAEAMREMRLFLR